MDQKEEEEGVMMRIRRGYIINYDDISDGNDDDDDGDDDDDDVN